MIITIVAGARPNFIKIAAGRWKKGSVPELWDGKTSERIVRILLDIYQSLVKKCILLS